MRVPFHGAFIEERPGLAGSPNSVGVKNRQNRRALVRASGPLHPPQIRTAPKAVPVPSDHDARYRARVDRSDTTGKTTVRHNSRMHHIGIDREHARRHVIVLVADIDIES